MSGGVKKWTMCMGHGQRGVVLIVTAGRERLEPLVSMLGDAGFYAFATVPSEVPALSACIAFDLVVVLHDVDDQTSGDVAALRPWKLFARNAPEIELLDIVRSKLDSTTT
ncbi:MAG: hypothetical protein AB7O24_21695 [Kofleriaceae bacterium]